MARPKFIGNEFYVADKVVKFPCNIMEFAEVDDIYVVLLSSAPNAWTRNNVYGVDKDGSLAWQLQDVSKVFSMDNDVPYVGLNILSSSFMRVINFNGVSFHVEPLTGKIVGKDVSAR